jgi:2-dehydro-3-deoxyphosphogluconate aldolase/(4S)-4-hydroxy-2-oxoglutarate aldolase
MASSLDEDSDEPLPRLWNALAKARVIAVTTLHSADQAKPLCRALLEGGVSALELTMRTPAAPKALSAMRAAGPALLLGAGTLLSPQQADAALAAGADFGLAPGFDPEVVRHCASIGLPFVPGIATASEIQQALRLGSRLLKFFPAEPLGGARGLRTLAAPFAHLGIKYLPLGGIGPDTTKAYLAERSVAAVGGSWITSDDLVRGCQWDLIKRNAARAAAIAAELVNPLV